MQGTKEHHIGFTIAELAAIACAVSAHQGTVDNFIGYQGGTQFHTSVLSKIKTYCEQLALNACKRCGAFDCECGRFKRAADLVVDDRVRFPTSRVGMMVTGFGQGPTSMSIQPGARRVLYINLDTGLAGWWDVLPDTPLLVEPTEMP